jgi:hypothetical protein
MSLKPLLGLTFNSQECRHTFVDCYNQSRINLSQLI